jgi:hypothetical protein
MALKKVVLRSPQQALALFRANKKRKDVERFRRKCACKIDKFYGKPLEISTLEFTREVVDIVVAELERNKWKVTHLSEFEGSNPRIRLEME